MCNNHPDDDNGDDVGDGDDDTMDAVVSTIDFPFRTHPPVGHPAQPGPLLLLPLDLLFSKTHPNVSVTSCFLMCFLSFCFFFFFFSLKLQDPFTRKCACMQNDNC